MTTATSSPALLASTIHLLNHRISLDSKSIVHWVPISDRQLQTKRRKLLWKTSTAVSEKSTAIEEKLERKKSERSTCLVAALISSLGLTSMAALAVYLRFSQQMEGGQLPLAEMFATSISKFLRNKNCWLVGGHGGPSRRQRRPVK